MNRQLEADKVLVLDKTAIVVCFAAIDVDPETQENIILV